MTSADIDSLVRKSAADLHRDESFTWVLLMCTCSLAASIVVILVLL